MFKTISSLFLFSDDLTKMQSGRPKLDLEHDNELICFQNLVGLFK